MRAEKVRGIVGAALRERRGHGLAVPDPACSIALARGLGLCRPLRKLQRRSGLMALAWHDLRHTFASHLAMRCVPMRAIQELMGHSEMKTTPRYSHLSPVVRRDAVEKLSEPAPQYMSGT